MRIPSLGAVRFNEGLEGALAATAVAGDLERIVQRAPELRAL
jgi:hypothetical protein